MVDLDLDAIEKALEGLTPGPWGHMYRLGDPASCGSIYGQDLDRPKIGYTVPVATFEAFSAKNQDANFIANARQWVPALAARVRELEAERKATLEMYWAMGRQLEAQRLAQEARMMELPGVISEREACAQIAEEHARAIGVVKHTETMGGAMDIGHIDAGNEIAEAIRARGEG